MNRLGPESAWDPDVERWTTRRGLWRATAIFFRAVLLACVIAALATLVLGYGDERMAEFAQFAPVLLSAIGAPFALSADPVLPALIAVLITLVVGQGAATESRFLLWAAGASATLGVAWALLASLTLFDEAARLLPEVLAMVAACAAMAFVVLILGAVITGFSPFVIDKREQQLTVSARTLKEELSSLQDRVGVLAHDEKAADPSSPPASINIARSFGSVGLWYLASPLIAFALSMVVLQPVTPQQTTANLYFALLIAFFSVAVLACLHATVHLASIATRNGGVVLAIGLFISACVTVLYASALGSLAGAERGGTVIALALSAIVVVAWITTVLFLCIGTTRLIPGFGRSVARVTFATHALRLAWIHREATRIAALNRQPAAGLGLVTRSRTPRTRLRRSRGLGR
ncbi:hypothetical protein SAMN04487846_0751 [Microbacterium sp. cf046]|uniref:hypothetical protein n=1 Tax=Microbacterium sp. cf046 TaxID=1761803 RepID=UPI0008F21D76|nr:hypothetical protein [Microbacterium sp. cf046]SFR93112.1 hypothetical protein SAMN04487846_0751 [Microbacterium sp. cf046]